MFQEQSNYLRKYELVLSAYSDSDFVVQEPSIAHWDTLTYKLVISEIDQQTKRD